MGEDRRELHAEEMGERASIEPLDTDCLQYLLDRSSYRTRIRRANAETFPRDAHITLTAEKQTEEKFKLLAGNERVLPGRALH